MIRNLYKTHCKTSERFKHVYLYTASLVQRDELSMNNSARNTHDFVLPDEKPPVFGPSFRRAVFMTNVVFPVGEKQQFLTTQSCLSSSISLLSAVFY